MRKWISILLVGVFVAIGCGALQYAHELDHLHASATAASKGHSSSHHDDDHDEGHCAVCAVLHMPTVSQGYVPLLPALAISIAAIFQFVLRSHPYSFRSSIDCRGPPVVG